MDSIRLSADTKDGVDGGFPTPLLSSGIAPLMSRLLNSAMTRFGQSARYWRLRNRLRRLRAKAIHQAFRIREAVFGVRASAWGVGHLSVQIVLPALLAAISVVVLHFLEAQWSGLVSDLGLAHTSLGIDLTRPISASAYSILLQSVAGVTGVFLALYFTAVNTVAATVYTTVPHDVRDLMVRDRLGNAYVRLVAYLTALAIFLLIAQASGGQPYHVALLLVVLLSAFAIFAFIKLGERAFYLADPTVLIGLPLQDFYRRAQGATGQNRQALDPLLQERHRRLARSSLLSVRSLLQISSKEAHLHGESRLRVLFSVAQLLPYYLTVKLQIPTTSKWFGERIEHKQWFLTESTEIDMASQTDTQLSPAVVPDRDWVEDLLLGSLLSALEDDLAAERYADVYQTLTHLAPVWSAFGANWSAKTGTRWTEKFTAALLAAISRRAGAGNDERTPPTLVGVADFVAYLPLAIELGFYHTATALKPHQLCSTWREADWSQPERPYADPMPKEVVETLEKVRAGVQFEMDAGTPIHTPGWYVAEIAFNSLAWELQREFMTCVDYLEKWYPTTADALTGVGAHDATGAVLSRGLEQAWKLSRHLAELEKITAGIPPEPPLIDVTRPSWDWSALADRVETFRREILRRMAGSIPALMTLERTSDIPDYLGQAVHRSGEACFEALARDDAQLFDELFRPYFVGIFVIIDRLRSQVANWSSERSAVTWMTEPLMDLLDISGYAMVFAEYHQQSALWDNCRALWENYLEGDDGKARLQFLSVVSSHHQHLFAISPRATIRTKREMYLSQLLSQLPRGGSQQMFSDGEVEHASPLIRRIAPSPAGMGMMFLNATDIFVARYLMRRNDAGGLDFGLGDGKVDELNEQDHPEVTES